MRFGHHSFPNRIQPNVPSHRLGLLRFAENMIVKSALPKPQGKFMPKNITCALLPLGHEFHYVGVRSLSFDEKMHMIRHHTESMNKNIHSISYFSQLVDCNSGARGIQENGAALLSADSQEINSFADIFVARKANLFSRNSHHETRVHWARMLAGTFGILVGAALTVCPSSSLAGLGRAKARPYIFPCAPDIFLA